MVDVNRFTGERTACLAIQEFGRRDGNPGTKIFAKWRARLFDGMLVGSELEAAGGVLIASTTIAWFGLHESEKYYGDCSSISNNLHITSTGVAVASRPAKPHYISLQPYTQEELATLTQALARARGFSLTPSAAMLVAQVAAGSPQKLQSVLRLLPASEGSEVPEEDAANVLAQLGFQLTRAAGRPSAPGAPAGRTPRR